MGALVGALAGVDNLRGEVGPVMDEEVLVAEVFLVPSLVAESRSLLFRGFSLSVLSADSNEMFPFSLGEVEGRSTEPKMSLMSISIAELRPVVGDGSRAGSEDGKNPPSTTRGDDEAETPILLFRPPGVCSEETELALCGERESSACLAVSLWEGIMMLFGLEEALGCSEGLALASGVNLLGG